MAACLRERGGPSGPEEEDNPPFFFWLLLKKEKGEVHPKCGNEQNGEKRGDRDSLSPGLGSCRYNAECHCAFCHRGLWRSPDCAFARGSQH